MADAGRLLIIAGFLVIGLGVVLIFSDKIPFLGKLPGDILIKKENSTFYFPLVTCLLISVVVSVLLWVFKR